MSDRSNQCTQWKRINIRNSTFDIKLKRLKVMQINYFIRDVYKFLAYHFTAVGKQNAINNMLMGIIVLSEKHEIFCKIG